MASSSQPLAQSETKALFLQRLGLNMDRPNDKALYHLMKSEVLAEREYMHADRSNLLPHIRDDPSSRGPYSYSQMTETALQNATIRIYQNASPVTRQYYDIGQLQGVVSSNWVIRWLLWHVFRYRDRRRLRRTNAPGATARAEVTTSSRQSPDIMTSQVPSDEEDEGEQSQTTEAPAESSAAQSAAATSASASTPARRPFDPVRDL